MTLGRAWVYIEINEAEAMVRVWSDVVRFAERIWEEHVPIVIVYGGLVLTHGGERGRCKVGEEEKLKSEFLCWFTFISSVFVQGRLRCPSKAHMFFFASPSCFRLLSILDLLSTSSPLDGHVASIELCQSDACRKAFVYRGDESRFNRCSSWGPRLLPTLVRCKPPYQIL